MSDDDYDPTFYYPVEDHRTDEQLRRERLITLLVVIAALAIYGALWYMAEYGPTLATAPIVLSSAPSGSP